MIKSFKELFANLKTKGREKIIVAGGEDIETLTPLSILPSFISPVFRGIMVRENLPFLML